MNDTKLLEYHKPKEYRLSKKEKGFIHYRARGYSLVESIIRAGYKCITRDYASSLGNKLEKKEKISKRIENEKARYLEECKITPELVISGLLEIAKNGTKEANRVRCWELLGNALPEALFNKIKQEVSGSIEFKYTDTEQKEFDRLRNIINN